jgi:predicted nucleotidyltransferase
MINKNELNKVVELAKKYKIGKLYLFGSALHNDPKDANDYDFAIEDFPSDKFFTFYGKLIMEMPKNVDLVDLSGEQNLFKKLVRQEARLIYDNRKA